MSDFAELIATVERVRAEKYPHLPADLVREILEAEAAYPDDRSNAVREIRRLASEALSSRTQDPDA